MKLQDLLQLMMSVPVSGPVLAIKNIPEPLRSEMLSDYDLTHPILKEPGDKNILVKSRSYAFWCGQRLKKSYKFTNYRQCTGLTLNDLIVTEETENEELATAVFRPGSYLVHVTSKNGDERLLRVGFGAPVKNFELRNCDWMITSVAISTYETDDELVIYTKSGNDYRLKRPYREIEISIEDYQLLRQGFTSRISMP